MTTRHMSDTTGIFRLGETGYHFAIPQEANANSTPRMHCRDS